MDWIELKRDHAQELFEEFCASGKYSYHSEYEALRTDLKQLFEETLSDLGISPEQISQNNNAYQTDLRFGLKMYEVLNSKYGMNVRLASTDGIWRYLSVCVVPDIVAARYGKDHPDRFWKKATRLWLRVIWWYIYLSWQGTAKQTMEILKDNNTDEILQLVDRRGRDGYRVDFCRVLMKKYAEMDSSERRTTQIFRKMMVLNTARVQVVEPELTPNGNRGYVDTLADYFMNRK